MMVVVLNRWIPLMNLNGIGDKVDIIALLQMDDS